MSLLNETLHRRQLEINEQVGRSVHEAREDAYWKAWDSLARYKFIMFGYWAGQWVLLNKQFPARHRLPNPFKALVDNAKAVMRAKV